MMAARANGQQVACVTATRGEQGSQDETRWPLEHLGLIRQKELEASLKIMDITEHSWLDYSDGQCARVHADAAAAKLVSLIRRVQPDTILTFGPDGMTGHADHRTVSHWTDIALQQLDTATPPQVYHVVESKEWYEELGKKWDEQFDVFFNIDQPRLVPEAEIDLCFKVPPALLDRKLEALRAQTSQTESMFTSMPLEELREIASCECFMRA